MAIGTLRSTPLRRALGAVALLVAIPVVAFVIAFLVHEPQPCAASDCDESSYVALLVAQVAFALVLLAVVADEVRLARSRTARLGEGDRGTG